MPRREPERSEHEDRAAGTARGTVLRFPAAEPASAHAPDALDSARRTDVDEWGRSEHARRIARAAGRFYYRHWFRVEWEHIERIPTTGGALLIANHAGAIPPDTPMIMQGVEDEVGRPVYGLADMWFRTVPFVSTLWSRSGGVPAHPDNAHRLLHDQQQLCIVHPEGAKGPSKNARERYKLRRFGRGGFVETAMRAGVPVVPIAVVGAEEAMPILYKLPVASLLKVPYLPVTVNQFVYGPLLGTFTYLPSKFRFRVLEPIRFDVEPNLPKYPRGRVLEEAEAIREKLQENLYEMLSKRRSVWFG
jgi:1-acyl-sn-glycerol-3-phosphate acyltransferase